MSGAAYGFHEVIAFNQNSLDADFLTRNEVLLSAARGAGYWSWKPQVVLQTMLRLPLSRDILIFYADAGLEFHRNVTGLLSRLHAGPRDVNVFSFDFLERSYTKREAFVALEADSPEYHGAPTAEAATIVFRNTLFSQFFVRTWLSLCTDPALVTDVGSKLLKLPDFKVHRHDQSLLSLLVKKFKLGWDEVGTHNTILHHRNKS